MYQLHMMKLDKQSSQKVILSSIKSTQALLANCIRKESLLLVIKSDQVWSLA